MIRKIEELQEEINALTHQLNECQSYADELEDQLMEAEEMKEESISAKTRKTVEILVKEISLYLNQIKDSVRSNTPSNQAKVLAESGMIQVLIEDLRREGVGQ
jgi:cell division septum initiation protein DivIVA